MRKGFAFTLGLFWLLDAALACAQIRVSLDTSSLVGQPGPFAIDFQLNDGSGAGDGNNGARLTDFDFNGGEAVGTPQLTGGAGGDLQSGVTLNETAFLNLFQQRFVPGGRLSFLLDLTGNVDAGPFPDQFSFAILVDGAEIATLGPARELLSLDLTATPNLTPKTYASADAAFAFPAPVFTTDAYFLHSKGNRFFFDLTPPPAPKAQFKDSPPLQRQPFSPIATWTAAAVTAPATLSTVGDLQLWLSLKNKNDQPTVFALRAELLKNGVVVVQGDTPQVSGLPPHRHRDDAALAVVVPFDHTAAIALVPGDVLSLRVLGKVAATSGPGSAVGVRLYYDSPERPAQLGVTVQP